MTPINISLAYYPNCYFVAVIDILFHRLDSHLVKINDCTLCTHPLRNSTLTKEKMACMTTYCICFESYGYTQSLEKVLARLVYPTIVEFLFCSCQNIWHIEIQFGWIRVHQYLPLENSFLCTSAP